MQQLARAKELRYEITDSLYAPMYEGGVVLEQQPSPGTKVKGGRRIFFTVTSHRQKMVVIPYVTGYSLRQAKNIIELAGLEIAELRYVDSMATNNILAEIYKGDTISRGTSREIEVGSALTLVVGRAQSAPPVAAPLVTGLSLSQAKSLLWERGLNVGRISMDADINVVNQKDARVSRQTPAEGTPLQLGERVSFSMSLGNKRAEK
jgi:beta-lactam-binding protein with PASTA domain